jgi:hypothetical protein
MPQDPSVLTIPGGAQFLTAPDGTMAPTETNIFVLGHLVDLTGKPIKAAPNRTGSNAAIAAIGPTVLPPPVGALALNQIYVTGLYNLDTLLPGPNILILSGTQLNTIFGPPDGAPLPNVPNEGFYSIDAVIDSHSCVATKQLPVPPNPTAIQSDPPDLANGSITWAVLNADQFAQGDPLTYLTEINTPFNVNTPAPGPARFANYDPTVPPLVQNDESGLFNKVQRA